MLLITMKQCKVTIAASGERKGFSRHRLDVMRSEIEQSAMFQSEVPIALRSSYPLEPTNASKQFFLEHRDIVECLDVLVKFLLGYSALGT